MCTFYLHLPNKNKTLLNKFLDSANVDRPLPKRLERGDPQNAAEKGGVVGRRGEDGLGKGGIRDFEIKLKQK